MRLLKQKVRGGQTELSSSVLKVTLLQDFQLKRFVSREKASWSL